MCNDFFNNHPMLGSMFDFDRDGSMSLGEAGAMGAFGALYATETMRASEEAERESSWDDDYDLYGSKKGKKKAKRDSDYDFDDDDFVEYDETRVYDINTNDADDVMDAVTSGDFDEADIEYLVYEALANGVEFSRGDGEELLDYISDRRLKDWLEDSL